MLKTFTAYVEWENGDEEEIDVTAEWPAEARRKAQAELDERFLPGGEIVLLKERFGLFL